MAQSILSNRYIGTGVLNPPDKLLDILLCKKSERIILVSREGYLQCLDEKSVSPSLEEMMRLGMSDYLVSGFIAPADKSILMMTQIGKCVFKSMQDIEVTAPGKSKGQAMISAQRREKGVRVVSASATGESDWAISLDQDGNLSLFAMKEILNTGVVPTISELVAFTAFSA